jgi:hypothetical protein
MGRKRKTQPFMLKSGNNIAFKAMGSSPIKQDTMGLKGVDIDPMAHKRLDKSKIPSFRDFISLEQQQAYADKVDAKRAKKRKEKEFKELEEAGGGTLDDLKTKEEERRKELTKEPATEEVSVPEEVKPENEINIGSNPNSYIY